MTTAAAPGIRPADNAPQTDHESPGKVIWDDEPRILLGHPQSAIVRIHRSPPERTWTHHASWKGWDIDVCSALPADGLPDDAIGPVDYSQGYHGLFEYTVMDLADCPGAPGWYVLPDLTCEYYRGDGWEIDDDELWEAGQPLRRATWREIREAEGCTPFRAVMQRLGGIVTDLARPLNRLPDPERSP